MELCRLLAENGLCSQNVWCLTDEGRGMDCCFCLHGDNAIYVYHRDMDYDELEALRDSHVASRYFQDEDFHQVR